MSVLKPTRAVVVLYHGDDMVTLAELKRTADQAAGGNRADDGADEAAAFNAFIDAARERAVEVILESIGWRRWRDLVATHPPRMVESEPDDDGKTETVEHYEDVPYGFNTETLPRDLLMFRDEKKRTIVGPELDVDGLAEFVEDDCSEGQIEQLWLAAHGLNANQGASPKALSDPRSDESTT